ncbi:erythromycin esterase family protein [Undibacterium sp. SXout11W]|uniref:erythromycin esterase family protein n=1 Tax=Undibacterium sp. SXout11W TaxID=3413050 RepID=UPI003BF39663
MMHTFRTKVFRSIFLSTALQAIYACPASAQVTQQISPENVSTYVHNYKTTSASDEDFSDLTAFGDAIGDARIVALAEQSHGASQEFDIKVRLLKYLHQKKGFDVLVIESGLFDMAELAKHMQAGEKLDDEAPGNVFYMYAKSAEGRKLLQYVDQTQKQARPLQFAGMDSQHTGKISQDTLVEKFTEYLRLNAPDALSSEEVQFYQQQTKAILKRFDQPYNIPDEAAQTRYFQIADKLSHTLCSKPETTNTGDQTGFWCRINQSMAAVAKGIWSNDSQRDQAMADNVIWLAEDVYAGKKIIIWGHAVHTFYDFAFDATHKNAGTVLRDHFKQQYYVVNTTAYAGSIRDFDSLKKVNIPAAPENSLEAILHHTGKTHSYVALEKNRNRTMSFTNVPARLFDFEYMPNISVNGLGQKYDAIFYYQDVEPVEMQR